MSLEAEQDTRGFWRRVGLRRAAGYGAAALLIVALVVILGTEAARHVHELERWLAGLGPWAPVAFVLAMAVLTSVFVPDTVFCLIAGALFGLERGTLLIACGGLLGAALQYALARRWFAGLASRLVASRPALQGVQTAVRGDPLRIQALLRLTPLNPTLVTYVVSSAGVRFAGFMLACGVIVPIWFTQVYFGYAGRRMALQAGSPRGSSWVEEGLLVLGLVAMFVVVVLVGRAAQRAIRAADVQPGR